MNNSRLNSPANVTSQALLGGGLIFIGNNNDPAWFYEASGRSGGLMQTQQFIGASSMHSGDVLWITYTANSYQDALTTAQAVQQNRGTVVAFGPQTPAGPPSFINWVDSFTPWTANDDFTLMGNVLSMWSLTGELAGATARQGKTLVFWQSISMPGSTTRNAHYSGSLFHTGLPQMAPIEAGVLSGAYLDYVSAMLNRIVSSEISGIIATGQLMALHASAGNPVTLTSSSHLLNFVPSRNSPYFTFLDDPSKLAGVLAGSLYLVDIGYAGVDLEFWRTVRLTTGANASWIESKLPTQADFTYFNDIVVNQQWDFGDCTVQVPGYDVCILPASGIAQLFVYESLLLTASTSSGSATRGLGNISRRTSDNQSKSR